MQEKNSHFNLQRACLLLKIIGLLILMFGFLLTYAQKTSVEQSRVPSPNLNDDYNLAKKGDVDTLWGDITDSTEYFLYGAEFFSYFGDSMVGYQFGTTYYWNDFYPATKKFIVEVGMRFDDLSDVNIRQVLIYATADVIGDEDEYVFMKMYTNAEDDTPDRLLNKTGVNTKAISEAFDSSLFLPIYFDDGPVYHDQGSFHITFDVDKLQDDSFGLVSTYEFDTFPNSAFRSALRFGYSFGGRWWHFDDIMSSGYATEEMVVIPVVEYNPAVGINELESSKALLAYPNPASDLLHLNWDNISTSNVEIQVADEQGKPCHKQNLSYGESVSLADFPSGTYYLIINSNGQSVAQLITITK